MRCPSCNADNPTAATACQSCGSALPASATDLARTPRNRRRKDTREVVASPRSLEYDRQVRDIFYLCLASMIPFLGLVLGPLGAARGWRLLKRARLDPAFTAGRAAYAAVLIGSFTGITNWLGAGLMALGLLLH